MLALLVYSILLQCVLVALDIGSCTSLGRMEMGASRAGPASALGLQSVDSVHGHLAAEPSTTAIWPHLHVG